MQLTRVLVATDFSEPAQVAVRHATAIAKSQGAELEVLHAYDASASSATAFAHEAGTTRLVADLLARDIEQHKLALLNLEATIREQQVRVSSRFVEGHPDEVVPHVATTSRAGLVVLGTHGRTGVARFLLGSVAANIARVCPAPIMVARGRAPERLGRILVASDFSPAADRALLTAVHLAGNDARVDVLHFFQNTLASMRSAEDEALTAETARRRGETVIARYRRPSVNVSLIVRAGTPGNGVQEQLDAERYDLVCVGSRSRHGLGHLILGSVAETTLRYSKCSVLVTHPPLL